MTLPPRILVAGASGEIGRAVLARLLPFPSRIGIHHFSTPPRRIQEVRDQDGKATFRFFRADLTRPDDCYRLVNRFVRWAGGIDALVQLSGGIARPVPWTKLTPRDWRHDIDLNLAAPFFLAQRTFEHMRRSKGARGGRVVLVSTASASHGGGRTSMAYGIAKAGVECLVKGLAKEAAPHGILVNAIAPGFIRSSFHTRRMKRTLRDLTQRARLVPLRRAGEPDDVAALVVYLLSDWNDYITGECIAVSGGDFL